MTGHPTLGVTVAAERKGETNLQSHEVTSL